MILATHALVGAAIGEKINNPWIIVAVSLIVHFLLDNLRHGEYLNRKSTFKDTTWKIALDLFTGLAIVLFYLYLKHPDPKTTFNILLGTFASMFPDSLTLLYWKLNVKFLKKLFEFHAWVHRYPPFSPERAWTLRNARNDIVFSLIAIIILFVK